MRSRLTLHRLTTSASPERFSQVLTRQCITKILKPSTFEHGLQSSKLTRYSYAAGELILPRRDVEEWVRWISDSDLLMIELPDDALQVVAQATGTDRSAIEGTSHLQDKRIAALIEAVEHEQANGFLSGRLYLDGISHALAAALLQTRGVFRRSLRSVSSGLAPAQLRRVTEYIYGELDQDLTIAKLSETAGVSPAYFSQMFHRSTGCTPHQFVLRSRIQRAKELLRTSDNKIIHIATACGFQTSQHFARVFRAFCDATPSEYRKNAV